jgi:hypothetical protein
VIEAGDVTDASYRVDENRWMSRCVLEVRFNATTFDRDEAGAVPSIESVGISATPEDPDAVETTAAVLFDEEVMP